MDNNKERLEIWSCISKLYLDQELHDIDYYDIASRLKHTGLTIKQLKEIDFYEVFPSLKYNLLSTAGAWSSFDQEWLVNACAKNRSRRMNSLFIIKTKLTGFFFKKMRAEQWDKLERIMKSLSNS